MSMHVHAHACMNRMKTHWLEPLACVWWAAGFACTLWALAALLYRWGADHRERRPEMGHAHADPAHTQGELAGEKLDGWLVELSVCSACSKLWESMPGSGL